jgi:iron(III) transport system substrate-binding protein
VVYNTELVDEGDLPRSLEATLDPRYRGLFGIAPANGSLQAHLAVYGVVAGSQALDELLAGLVANEPGTYPKNSAIVQAVIAGEVEWGLVNHYYLLRALVEAPEAPARNFFMTEGPASGFVNLAGAGMVSDASGGVALLEFLLSEEAQRYFAEETFEYPLVDGVDPAANLAPLAELVTPEVDFGAVSAALEETLTAINNSGLMR